MTNTQFYLPTVLPQWGIFAGIVLITIGYVDKKDLWTRLGWIVLIVTGLAALYFNLFGELSGLDKSNNAGFVASLLTSTGWQTVAGGILAVASLIMLQLKKRRYPLLAILTIVYFILLFFQYYQASVISGKEVKTVPDTEQNH